MNYTPNDIQNMEIKKTLFGYSEDAVNEVLDKVIDDYSRYIKENLELKDKISLLNESLQNYKNIEESLQNSLLVAQKTSEEVKKNAYEKAQNIITEAEMKAQQIVGNANSSIAEAKHEYEDLRGKIKLYRSKCESLIQSQLDLLREMTK